jgi:hypothetical protein
MATSRTAPLVLPARCSALRIARDTEVARGEFRARRLQDPLADYNVAFPIAEAAATTVVGALDDVLAVPSDRGHLASLVANKAAYATLRSLAASPISADDLETLVRASVNQTALRANQELADSLAGLLRSCLDPKRFPWIVEGRDATPEELQAAKLATAVLTATSAVQAGRRGTESSDLEGRVVELVKEAGYSQVAKLADGITSLANFPEPGTFMRTTKLGGHNADLVIRLRDKRLFAIECKASNSEVNGYKRLNKEVVVDAGDWYRRFGADNVVVGAALRGVFKAANVVSAQEHDVYLFWWHRLRALSEFLEAARPTT